RIDPTVDRDVWGTGYGGLADERGAGIAMGLLAVVRRARPGVLCVFSGVAPRSTAQVRIVVGAVDLPRQIPTQRATHKNIRREVLLFSDPGQGHRGSQGVRQNFG